MKNIHLMKKSCCSNWQIWFISDIMVFLSLFYLFELFWIKTGHFELIKILLNHWSIDPFKFVEKNVIVKKGENFSFLLLFYHCFSSSSFVAIFFRVEENYLINRQIFIKIKIFEMPHWSLGSLFTVNCNGCAASFKRSSLNAKCILHMSTTHLQYVATLGLNK